MKDDEKLRRAIANEDYGSPEPELTVQEALDLAGHITALVEQIEQTRGGDQLLTDPFHEAYLAMGYQDAGSALALLRLARELHEERHAAHCGCQEHA